MASNAINNPRIDRAFVNGSGQLTEYGYSVLARIIERVGGAVGDILNGAELTAAIESLSLAPQPRDWGPEIADIQSAFGVAPTPTPAQPQEPDLSSECQSLRAELDQLRQTVNGLLQGYQL